VAAAVRLRALLDEPSEVFDRLAEHACLIARTPVALITLIDGEQQSFIGAHGVDLESTAREVALCTRVIVAESNIVIPDTHSEPSLLTNPLVTGPFQLRAYAGTPLVFNGQHVGALCVVDHQQRVFDDRCLGLLKSVARSVEALFEQRMQTTDSSPRLSGIGALEYEEMLSASGQAILVTDLQDRVTWASRAAQVFFDAGPLVGEPISSVRPRSKSGDTADRHIEERLAPWIDSESGKISGTIRSFVDVTRSETERRRLERLANTEPLTGAANRRRFEARVTHEIQQLASTESDDQIVIGILDLDRFKAVNDRLGHQAGDDVLIQVAEGMIQALAEHGLVARLGGDEFAFVVSIADSADLAVTVDGILRSIRTSMLRFDDERRHVCASVGVTVLKPTDLTPSHVLSRADFALYQAKEAGGNRSWIHR